jgi:hypothetical protein
LHPFFKNQKFFTGFFWETLTGLDFLCWHTPWWAPVHQWWTTCLHFLNAKYFNDRRKFRVQDARITLLKTSNLEQRECRQQLERKSANYPLAIIYSRVKFWVRTTEDFNQPQLSLLPHGVHHPRRTSCSLWTLQSLIIPFDMPIWLCADSFLPFFQLLGHDLWKPSFLCCLTVPSCLPQFETCWIIQMACVLCVVH